MFSYNGQKPTRQFIVAGSSFINQLGYNHNERLLFVGCNNKTIVYNGVDEVLYERFKVASSKGKFLNSEIKQKNFESFTIDVIFEMQPTFDDELINKWKGWIQGNGVFAL